LQNGSVSKEFLGGTLDSDATPLDTDLSRIIAEDLGDFETAIQNSIANGYGQIMLYIPHTSNFRDSSQMSPEELIDLHYPKENPEAAVGVQMHGSELFYSGVLGERHYGIRTGFPSSDIAYCIVREPLASTPKDFRKICFNVAKNNVYIPLVNEKGKLLYTPEEFERDRKIYAGIDKYEGDEITPLDAVPNKALEAAVGEIGPQIPRGEEAARQIYSEIADKLSGVLEKHGLPVLGRLSDSLIGSKFYLTGSTARGTHDPEDTPDYDLIVHIDSHQANKIGDLVQDIKALFPHTGDDSHGISKNSRGGYQIRLSGVDGLSLPSIDLDIGILTKAQPLYFSTDEAIQTKFTWIEENLGEEALTEVKANIVFAKRLFKKGGVYKRQQGGLCGVGIENWVLLYQGSAYKAFSAFSRCASGKGGKIKPLAQFKKEFPIMDPGEDLMSQRNDNFIENLTPESYARMLELMKPYIA
jgi:hypothetical protein